MYFTIEKLEARTRQLEAMRCIDMVPITPMISMAGMLPVDEVYSRMPAKVDGPPLNLGDDFTGRDRYLWVRKTVMLPAHREGHEIIGLFDFGKTGGGHNSGFESLLYVNGKPYQGVDTNHNDVVFEKMAGQEVELTFMLWTGLEGGGPRKEFRHEVRQAHIGYLHQATDEFYYFSKAIYKTLKLLPDSATEKYDLAAALDQAYQLINWDQDKFHATVVVALDSLLADLGKMEKKSAVTVSVVGHTHIDVAWLWRLKHTREKAIRSFSTVLRLMEEFDEYIFLQTQPQLYKYVKNDCPELYEQIKAKIAQGRWEPDGGMWVEADCNISSGEALVRQLTHGIAFFKEEFDTDCEYLWLPDVFGYSWALPQILKLCNIKTFMTTKISWNQYNTIPHDLFWWRGIDGSEILTYFVNTPETGHPIDARFSTYNGQLSPRTVIGSWQKFKDKPLSNETLISYGYGDGGGGVNRNMLKMRRAMDKLPGLPHVKPTRAGDFFRRLNDQVAGTDRYVHTWDGELYLEYHRGTYTSQANNKRYNRRLELALARCEWLSVMIHLLGNEYPAQALYDAWEIVLLHQFHDIIPGSSIREVYEDSDKTYASLTQKMAKLEQQVTDTLITADKNCYTLYHFGSFTRRDLVFIPVAADGTFSSDGCALSAQKAEGGWLVDVKMEPLAMQTITFTAGQPENTACVFSADMAAGTLETPFYSLVWDKNGHLTSLFDRINNRQILAESGNVLEIYEDKPLKYDNWDIDIFYTQKREVVNLAAAPELVECGSERSVIRFRYTYNHSSFIQDMILYRRSGRIDFVVHADWQESDRLLKVAFPVKIRATKATYDIQFGHVERPTHFNTSWDWARFEVVGHKWADVSEADYGVSLINNCKYGYNVKDNTLRLTLLKSSKYPDTEADMGEHDFAYALLPHSGTVTQGDTIEESVKFNSPIQVIPNKLRRADKKIIRLDSDQVHIDAVKLAEQGDAVVIRFHECRGTHCTVQVTSDYTIRQYAPCNLLENNLEEVTSGTMITVEVKPFEICTFKLWF